MKSIIWRGLLALAVIGAAGCASLRDSGGISLSVTHVLPTQASLLETSAALTLRLVNEGAQPVHLAGGVHRLYLNDSYVGRAVSSERIIIPAFGSATQTVTAYLENLVLMRKATELSQTTSPRVAYRLESRLHRADERGNIAATTSGELDLSGFVNPGVAPARVSAERS